MNDLRSSIRNILKNVFLWIAFLTLSLSVLGCGGSSASIKAVLQRDHALAQRSNLHITTAAAVLWTNTWTAPHRLFSGT